MGLLDTLRTDFYRHQALAPTMPWKDNVPPTAPISASVNSTSGFFTELRWRPGPAAADGEVARWYVVYRIPARPGPITAADLANPANIQAITDTTFYSEPITGTNYLYALTALDRLHNESAPAQLIYLLATASPQSLALFEGAVPNPFGAETRLAFTLPNPGPADLRVYDVAGREVAVLNTGPLGAGRHEVTWLAAEWPAGVYVAVLRTSGGIARQKVLRVP
jgi:hypothetical protein